MQLTYESVGAVLAAAKVLLARVRALTGRVDAQSFNRLLAVAQATAHLGQALAECNSGDAQGFDEWIAAAQARSPLKQALAECGSGDAQGFNRFVAACQARACLRRALAKCGFGPDLCDVTRPEIVSFPSGEEGLVYDRLWELWLFCYEDDAERCACLNLDRTVKELETELELRGWANPAPKTAVSVVATDEEDERILRALAEAEPRLLTQDSIEAASRVSRRTISSRMPRLLKANLVVQPRGRKSGTTITPAGKALLERIGRTKPAR